MSRVAKTAVALIIISMLSKILGFGRELILGATYGASTYSDIYITSMNIPTILFAAIGSAIMTTFIPLYYENKKIGGNEKSAEFTNNIFNIVFIISVVLVGLSLIFTEQIVHIFAMGFNAEKLITTINFTRIMLIGGIFIILSNIMTGILQTKDNFIVSGFIWIPFNIIIIISIVLSSKYDIYILPIGTLIAMISQFLFQIPFAYKEGYRYRVVLNLDDEYVKKMIWLIAPIFIGVAVNQVNTMVDRTLASTLVEGSISALNYASRLNGFVMGLFITTIASVIYPMLSKLSIDNNKDEFIKSIVKSMNIVTILVLPISVGAIVLANPIVKLLFQRGAFDENATRMTSIALVFYSIGMIAFGLRDILGKIFYSLQDTRIPMINGVMAMTLNIVLNLAVVKFMGHAGLAFATSVSAIICTILLFISLKKKISYFGQDKILKTSIKSLISASVMGIITYFSYKILFEILGVGTIKEATALFSSIIIGAISYGVLITMFKVEEVSMIIKVIKNKVIR